MRKLFLSVLICFAAAGGLQAASVVDGDCAACHGRQVNSMARAGTLGQTHAAKGMGSCLICHDKASLEKSHEKVAPGEQGFIAARRYGAEFCTRCHGGIDRVAKSTEKSTAVADIKGKVVNPHALPAVKEHEKLGECSVCHRVHKKQPDVSRDCKGCHHTGEFIACSGCHHE